jgi:hypothetical protein
VRVNGAGDDFFSGARLAENEHRGVGRRDLFRAIHDRLESFGLTDHYVFDARAL